MVQAFGPVTFGVAALSLAVSAAGVWVTIRVAHMVGAIDVPNGRSSHSTPTTRMGGVAIVAAVVLPLTSWAFLVAGEGFFAGLVWTVPLFALVMSGLGLWDDLAELSPLFRFLVQIACSAAILLLLARRVPWFRVEGYILSPVFWVPLALFWVVWMMNLYNFMDGIDGLASGEAAVAGSFFFLVFAHYGESGWAVANLLVAAASMGFLVYNWPPATVFMGDTGSYFLGAFFGMQSVAAALSTPVPFVVLVLPFSNFLLDTTVTLLRRMIRREKWHLPHRTHFYQRMVTGLGMSNRKVTLLELAGAAASCGAAFAYVLLGPKGRFVIVSVVIAAFVTAGLAIRWKEQR